MVSTAEPAKSAASDDALLDRFQKKGDRDALGELAQRYAGMVYSVARRQTGKAEAAEDVSQEVFMLFARRAGGFRKAGAIGVWLMRTCRYVAANAMRTEKRRRRRERRAAVDPCGAAAPGEDRTWEEVAPLIDEAIGRLGKEDQAAVALRFFRGMSLREVGEAIGASEDAARMRVGRAIERLRANLLRAGAPGDCGPAELTALLAAKGVEAAPAKVVASAGACAKVAAASGKVPWASIFRGVVMTSGTKSAVVATVVAAALIGGAGWVVVKQERGFVANQPQANPGPTVMSNDWETKFDGTYFLGGGEGAKCVAPPFIPERDSYLLNRVYGGGTNATVPYSFECMILRQVADGRLECAGLWMQSDKTQPVGMPGRRIGDLAQMLSNDIVDPGGEIRIWQITGSDELMSLRLPGDWVVAEQAAPQDIFDAVANAASARYQRRLAFVRSDVARQVVVISGKHDPSKVQCEFQSPLLPDLKQTPKHFFLSELADWLSMQTHLDFLVDTSNLQKDGYTYSSRHTDVAGRTEQQNQDDLLKSLGEETGWSFKVETRRVAMWTLTEVPNH